MLYLPGNNAFFLLSRRIECLKGYDFITLPYRILTSLFVVFLVGWGLKSGIHACKSGTQLLVHFALVILEMGSGELVTHAGLKPGSSQFQPPKEVGL
jgi:hypothetical protein